MSDERELRAALETAQGKLKSAEAEAAKSRAKSQELEHELQALRAQLAASGSQQAQALLAERERELESLRAQVAGHKAELEAVKRAHSTMQRRTSSRAPLFGGGQLHDGKSDSAAHFALFGVALMVGGGWFASQGTEGALCLGALGAFFAAPWVIVRLFL